VVFITGDTLIDAVVDVVLHRYVTPPDAVRIVDSPRHIFWLPDITAVGFGFTVSTFDAVPVQPLVLVTVTVYVVVTRGATLMTEVVAPILHTYVPPPLAVRLVLVPEHIAFTPLICAAAVELTVTVRLALFIHPFVLVAVTVYVVVTSGLTVIDADVDPLLQT
jgi:hypothetical protein